MADGSKKRKKNSSAEELLVQLWNSIENSDQPKKKQKTSFIDLQRDPIDCRRVYHSQPRPNRKNKKISGASTSLGCEDILHHNHPLDTPEQNSSDSLNELIDEAEKLITGFKGEEFQWGTRMDAMNFGWESSREELFEAMLSNEASANVPCFICQQEPAVVRCCVCLGGNKKLCRSCDDHVHSQHPLHDREIFCSQYYKAVSPTTTVDSDGTTLTKTYRCLPLFSGENCPNCGCKMQTELTTGQHIVITLKGRFDLNAAQYHCCVCNVQRQICNAAIIKMGFWPGTTKNVSYIFDQELFRFWDVLQKKMPGVSERAFVSGLEDYSVEKGRLGTINISTFNRSFKEWKFCNFELDKLKEQNWMECPCCSFQQHSAHVDANMKLYRFKVAGRYKKD